MRKRILSLLLVLCMLLPTLPLLAVPAAAVEPTLYRYWEDAAKNFTKTISETTYRENYPVLEDATAEEAQYAAYVDWLKAEGTFAVDQGDYAWKLGQYDLAAGQISELISRVGFFALPESIDGGYHDVSWFVTEAVYQELLSKYLAKDKAFVSSGIWGGYALGGQGQFYRMTSTATKNKYIAMEYTVEQAGSYTFSVDDFVDKGAHALAILVDGVAVWPVDAKADDSSTWFATNSSTTTQNLNTAMATAPAVDLKAGQKVSFVTICTTNGMWMEIRPVLARVPDGYVAVNLADVINDTYEIRYVTPGDRVTLPIVETGGVIGWDADGNGTADYPFNRDVTVDKNIAFVSVSVSSRFAYGDNYPILDNDKVVYPGPWDFGTIVLADDSYVKAEIGGGTFVSSFASVWNDGGAALYYKESSGWRQNQFALDSCIANAEDDSGRFCLSIRYYATYSGTVILSYEVLQAMRDVGDTGSEPAENVSQGYAIYHNGYKIWPADDDWYWYNSEEVIEQGKGSTKDVLAVLNAGQDGAFGVRLGVVDGDTIEFRTAQGNSTTQKSIQVPSVEYVSLAANLYDDPISSAYNQTVDGQKMGMDENGKMTMPEGWAVIAHPKDNFNTTWELRDSFSDAGINWFANSELGAALWTKFPRVGYYNGNSGWESGHWAGDVGSIVPCDYVAGYQYTAQNTGKADIHIDSVRDTVDGLAGGTVEYMAVFVDGVMVWPTKGGDYQTLDDWFHLHNAQVAAGYTADQGVKTNELVDFLGDMDGLSQLYVELGDKIEVLFRHKGSDHDVCGVSAYITVTETPFASEEVVGAVDPANKALLGATIMGGSVKLLYKELDNFVAWDVDGDGVADVANGDKVGLLETTEIGAVRATSSKFVENLPFTTGNKPTYNSSKTPWKLIQGDLNVDVAKNSDSLSVLMSNVREMTNSGDQCIQSANGLWSPTGGGMYVNNNELIMPDSSGKNAVGVHYVAPYTGTVSMDFVDLAARLNANWDYVRLSKTVGGVTYYALCDQNSTAEGTDKTYYWVTTKSPLTPTFELPESGSDFTSYYKFNGTTMTETAVTEATAGQKRPVSVKINPQFYMMLMKNGEVIWPTNGQPYNYVSDITNSYLSTAATDKETLANIRANAEPFPTDLQVVAGDTLSFMFVRSNTYAERVIISPVVTYDKVYGNVQASVGTILGDKFTVNMAVAETDHDVRATKYGIEILSGLTEKILAKDAADEIVYRTYQVIRGQTIYFEEKTTSLAAILEAYAKGNNGLTNDQVKLAASLSRYCMAAANYFDGDELPFPVKDILAGVEVDTSDDAKKITGVKNFEEPPYGIGAATLTLEDQLLMTILVQQLDGKAFNTTGLYLRITDAEGNLKDDVDGFSWPTQGGNNSKRVVSFAVPVADYNKKLYLTVMKKGDGDVLDEPVSNTIAYGVMTYIARQFGNGTGKADSLLRAIVGISAPPVVDESATTLLATDVTEFKYCGTWEPLEDGTMKSHWNDSYVEFDFYGSSVTLTFSQQSTFKYSVDGGADVRTVTANAGDYTITVGEGGAHTLRIQTPGRNYNVYFSGVKTESKYYVARTEERQHYIHFVGDSISDQGQSYTHMLGAMLNWDYAVTAVSGMALQEGQGYWKNNNGYNPGTGITTPDSMADLIAKNTGGAVTNVGMETAFFKYGHPHNAMQGDVKEDYAQYYYNSTKYDNTYETGYTPDIVFIFLGTNDHLSADETTFAAKYVEFVGKILATYGEDTDIWVMDALSSSNVNNMTSSTRFARMDAAFAALRAEYGDTITVIDFDNAREPVEEWKIFGEDVTKTDGTHPPKEGHDILADYIAGLLRDKYPVAE